MENKQRPPHVRKLLAHSYDSGMGAMVSEPLHNPRNALAEVVQDCLGLVKHKLQVSQGVVKPTIRQSNFELLRGVPATVARFLRNLI